jgi:hypothetical protein
MPTSSLCSPPSAALSYVRSCGCDNRPPQFAAMVAEEPMLCDIKDDCPPLFLASTELPPLRYSSTPYILQCFAYPLMCSSTPILKLSCHHRIMSSPIGALVGGVFLMLASSSVAPQHQVGIIFELCNSFLSS